MYTNVQKLFPMELIQTGGAASFAMERNYYRQQISGTGGHWIKEGPRLHLQYYQYSDQVHPYSTIVFLKQALKRFEVTKILCWQHRGIIHIG